MGTALQIFAEAVAEMYLKKRGMGYAPDSELEEFATLLRVIDWSTKEQTHPPSATVPGLRHLTAAIASATRAGHCPVLEALRACVGFVPWETFYLRTPWSSPFLDDFASGELIGPAGCLPNPKISLGLFILGPDTLYSEHAHASTEIYYILGGGGEWALDRADATRQFNPGDLVFTNPHQRHSIRTDSAPLLAAYTWKADPAAGSYYNERGPWGSGRRVFAELVHRGEPNKSGP